MKKIVLVLLLAPWFTGCKPGAEKAESNQQPKPGKMEIAGLLSHYYDERMQLFPLEATTNGDTRFNHLLPADFTDSYRSRLKKFFTRYHDSLQRFSRNELEDNDRKSLDILKYETAMALEGLELGYMGSSQLGDNRFFPFDQFNGLPLLLGQMGSGTGIQPFKTVNDYNNWLQRVAAFPAWTDSAILYFKKGIAENQVLPRSIVVKMIPQMQAMVTGSTNTSLFYEPIALMPASFSDADKKRLTQAFIEMIEQQVVPSYKKLVAFLEKEYLPASRSTTGINALPNGDKYYAYMVRYWTTINKSPDEIYHTGISEVKRIHEEMEKIKQQVNFVGDLKAFFEFMKTDKQFMPYKKPEEVLNAFRSIQARIDPNVEKMFGIKPKTKFEIRQTEAFRQASASAEYYPGLPDNSRPGIFYVPIVDATRFNVTGGMESLFLHEAIPGHHFQMSLQTENDMLPAFRRFIWYGAYGEGYALYCESLGKELGLFTDPYQYMGALGDEILRAMRLVVDVGMHTGKITRGQAIKYMTDNSAMSERDAEAEIERYMVYPAQALSYKTGALKIKELREKYQRSLGDKFKLSTFHDEFLKDGCMPLDIMERSFDEWAEKQKNKK